MMVRSDPKDKETQRNSRLKATLANSQRFTEDQEEYVRTVLSRLEEGALPRKTAQKTFRSLENLGDELLNPLKVLATLQKNIPERLLLAHYVEQGSAISGKREVILSMYLGGG